MSPSFLNSIGLYYNRPCIKRVMVLITVRNRNNHCNLLMMPIVNWVVMVCHFSFQSGSPEKKRNTAMADRRHVKYSQFQQYTIYTYFSSDIVLYTASLPRYVWAISKAQRFRFLFFKKKSWNLSVFILNIKKRVKIIWKKPRIQKSVWKSDYKDQGENLILILHGLHDYWSLVVDLSINESWRHHTHTHIHTHTHTHTRTRRQKGCPFIPPGLMFKTRSRHLQRKHSLVSPFWCFNHFKWIWSAA